MVKVRVTCNKNIIERFGVKKPEGWDFQYINYPCSDEELVAQCKDADIIFCGPVDFFRKEVIDQLENCKLIQSLGVGFDKIDLNATKEKGIYVCNNRAVNAVPVAELALGHMISSLRRMPEADAKIKAGGVDGFNESFRDYQVKGQSELSSRTIGLVGLGAIGKAAVRMLKAFGCKVVYYDVFRADEAYEIENDLEFCTYDEILEKCDIISYHVPVLDSTRNMVRKETIEKMKQDAIIVNVARGEIVNNEDLAEALNNGRIFAGLDVIAPEPPTADHPLFNLTDAGKARLSITPHIAGTTDDAFIRMSQWSYDNMVKVMNGERPNNVVNGL
ncbi:2-hydroxyacid dehydrogenase [Peptostreptococcus equinus]|uniref:D-isomer specific 2-hydroxyacid dehydrogenase family protein n=1 Tax=Peptostreptococcus equinus TaxID=3003601 RepID=A0ABY7JPN9_9FIRM|nr:D-isomer specific 2-hydroxyacid dehydrogenase family protein [Peptostreptococcus sp. CBA3647]WAW15339.1 D-isomer specific 2-hydroxyacid dehydrogenase family protein [Peptostreptococcus sp. CBA3647]